METWHSPRWESEQLKKDKLKIFDEFIDLALDGVVTLEQAIGGIKEVLATEEEVGKTA